MMASRFFITGLPRSRTAWMAAWMSSCGIHCHHEALSRSATKEDYLAAMSLNGYPAVGNSDCAIALAPELIDGRLVIIERDPGDVIASLVRIYGDENKEKIAIAVGDLSDAIDHLDGLRIAFHELDDRLSDIWEYCIGYGFDPRRAEQFMRLNIQTRVDPMTVYDSFLLK